MHYQRIFSTALGSFVSAVTVNMVMEMWNKELSLLQVEIIIVLRRICGCIAVCPLPEPSMEWHPNATRINAAIFQYRNSDDWFLNVTWPPMNGT